jgi:TolB-like protein/DNA-binding winged helix-turn-helix (wHTH) protein/Flp pilus assembly protein TadD
VDVELGELSPEAAMASEPALPQEPIRFGDDFELNVRLYELRRSGRVVKLERIPMELLLLLVEQKGELVTREQIVERIWGKDVFLDTDNSINGAIRKIRQVLRDDPEQPRFVQTVTGKGYRFLALVSANGAEKHTVSSAPRISAENSSQTAEARVDATPTKRRAILLLALGSCCAIGLGAWLAWQHSYAKSGVPQIRSIAVLPMENLSGDAAQEYFADGMTDELITDLAKIGALRVISRTSVMRYKKTKKGLPEIARELNVDGIVEGSVTRSGQRVRITAQLLHAPTDRHLWAETYDRDLGDVLKLQSDVALAIAQQVRAQLTPQQQARLHSARPVNPQAYEAYLRGRYYLTTQFTMAGPLNTAKSYFEESIRKDPGLALAYWGLADSYIFLTFSGQLSPEGTYRPANEALRKALELDENAGEIHDALGVLRWQYEWDLDGAEREFNRAIALAPSYSCAHEDRSIFLSFAGRRAEALAEIAKSNELDLGPSAVIAESESYYQLRDYAGLLEASRKGVVSYPNEWVEHNYLGIGYEGTGKLLEAISEYQKAVELSDGSLNATAALAHAFAVIGRRAEAEKILRDVKQKSKSGYVSPYMIATIYAGLGEKDRALELLEQAYQERSLDLASHLKADLRFDNLRSEPRFQALVRRVGFPQ